MLLGFVLLVSCTNSSEKIPETVSETESCPNTVILSDEERAFLMPVFDDLDRKRVIDIPEEFLISNHDLTYNTKIFELYNSDCDIIGYGREIFTDIPCFGGVCLDIHYYQCLNPDGSHKDVSSIREDPYFYRKYWAGSHDLFTEEDVALTRELITNPPDEYTDVEDIAQMVDLDYGGSQTTAPTVPEFQDITVRGGVFTIYVMIEYRWLTEDIWEVIQ